MIYMKDGECNIEGDSAEVLADLTCVAIMGFDHIRKEIGSAQQASYMLGETLLGINRSEVRDMFPDTVTGLMAAIYAAGMALKAEMEASGMEEPDRPSSWRNGGNRS